MQPSRQLLDMKTRRWCPIGLGFALLIVYAWTAHLLGAGIIDDAYIFLRYARNIWAGAGPVFNVGDPVEGYTSPLWLAMLTIAWPASVDAPRMATTLSALCGFALIVILLVHDSRQARLSGIVAAAFLSANPQFVFWAFSGMDTALFTLLFIITVLVFEADLKQPSPSFARSGWLLALAGLARLEALWLVPAFAYFIWAGSDSFRASFRRLLTLVVPLLAVHGAHTIWRQSYYGAWLPNTFDAKVGVPRVVLLKHGIAYLAHSLKTVFPLLVVVALLMRDLKPAARIHLLVPFSLAVWWLVCVLLVGGDYFALSRFLIPVYALVALMLARIVRTLVSPLAHNYARFGLIVAAAVVVNASAWLTSDVSEARAEVERARGWTVAGKWCATHLPEGSIAVVTAGAIPFYCARETIDLLGLVDRHVARNGLVYSAGAPGHQKYATEYVVSRAPRYIFFSFSGQTSEPLLRTPESRRRLPASTNFAILDLVNHPVVMDQYDYRGEPLPNGTWMEFLQKRNPAK